MKDDLDFNIHLVSIIEVNPYIYDHTILNYSNKHVINNTWERIAKLLSVPGKYLHCIRMFCIQIHKVII